jgi:tetratricopeptide (TPR) repeat protein
MMRRLFAGLLLLAAAQAAAATDADVATSAFREGNAAYERGAFAAADSAYARAEAAGAADARLHYNRGNSLFRLGRLGQAILHYEKARVLAPADADIRHNLEFARSRTRDRIPEAPENFVTRSFETLQASYTPRGGVWIAYGLFAGGFLALAAGLFLGPLARVFATLAAIAAFGALLVFAPFLAHKVHRHGHAARAVVLEDAADLYSGPGTKYELLFRVHEGTAFAVTGREGDWLAVKLPDGRGGFVRAALVGEV